MIPVDRLLYKIELKLNKVASGQNQHIQEPDKILALNEAQTRLLKKKVGVNNLYQIGFDGFRARYEELQNLVVQSEQISVTKTDDIKTSYEVDISKLQNKYFLPIGITAIGKRGGCEDRVVNVPSIIKHSDINFILDNTHFNPSFLYQETVAVVSGDKIIIYTCDPAGDFEVTRVYLTYLRYPQKIEVEGYIDFEGEPTSDLDCELPDVLEDELLELAIMELGYNSGNNMAAEASQIKSKNSEL